MRRSFHFGVLVALIVADLVCAGAKMSNASARGAVASPNDACASPSPCFFDENTGSGPGIEGVALHRYGVIGVTFFASNASTGRAGVFGSDEGTGAFNDGVRGTSNNGTGVFGLSGNVGVEGVSTAGQGIGVFGTGANVGMWGQATGSVLNGARSMGIFGTGESVGIHGESNGGTGIEAKSLSPNGKIFVGIGSVGAPMFTIQDNGDTSVLGALVVDGTALMSGIKSSCSLCVGGVVADSNALYGVEGIADTTTTVGVEAQGAGGTILEGMNSGSTPVFDLDDGGNVTIAGQLTTAGSCHVGCAVSHMPGAHIVSYAPQESQPTMEDFGDAQLVAGQAYVRLDQRFADVIDDTTGYLVFITPEGDNNGLYVTEKSMSGFAVRESRGGHATIAFSYRIVAKPYGSAAARLPMIVTRHRAATPHRLR